jgi:hypothetical protein
MLVDPNVATGMPAPWWFIQFFKVLGFTLHSLPMNLWYAGIVIALGLRYAGGEHGRTFSRRLMLQMPVIVALGINMGIVPLLFVQVAYTKFFYPATILMAWPWLSIIFLLIPAYYGVYIYSFGLRREAGPLPWQTAVGWIAALFFVVIGFLFANGMSLLDRISAWPELWRNQEVGGAVLGTALNVGDPRLIPRWLLMFGLAIGTTAAWMAFDAGWFVGRDKEAYRGWASSTAWKLAAVSAAWFAAAGSWYVFGTWDPEIRRRMFSGGWMIVTGLTAVAPGLPLALLFLWRNRPADRLVASAVILGQLGVLAVNAVSRQVVQNLKLSQYAPELTHPQLAVQWGPLVMFLIVFVAGLGVVVWMIAQVVTKSSGLGPKV